MRSKPETIANVSVKEYSFSKQIKGIVEASQFKWNFTWSFNKGSLLVNPPLGRALIEDALLRFLLKKDYELEAGNEYKLLFQPSFNIDIFRQSEFMITIILQDD